MSADSKCEISVVNTSFRLDGHPFPFTGLSFFNAIYNPSFNAGDDARRQWIAKFQAYGINVLRIWGQWDSKRTCIDTSADATLYRQGGRLNETAMTRLKALCVAAGSLGSVIELVLFSEESWRDGIRIPFEEARQSVAELTRELAPYRNLAFQVWNEHALHAMDLLQTIKSIDPHRLVTNSPGASGMIVAGRGELESALDYLTPHTIRSMHAAAPHWEVAPLEIEYLIARFRKPVVDDEPARNGTPLYGGPTSDTCPYDHILQIAEVWRRGGYVVYHHDMFQTAYGSAAIPPSGIPDPEFSLYHRQVFEFLSKRDRYLRDRASG